MSEMFRLDQMLMRRPIPVALLRNLAVAWILPLTALACGDDKPTRQSEAATSGSQSGSQSAPEARRPPEASAPEAGKSAGGQPSPGDQKPDVTEKSPEPPPEAKAFARELMSHLRRRIQQENNLEGERRAAIERKLGKLRRMRKLVRSGYADRNHQPFGSDGDGLSADGKLAMALILDVESHGLEPSPYPIKALTAAKEALESALGRLETQNQKAEADPVLGKLAAISSNFDPQPGDAYRDQLVRIEGALLAQGLSDAAPVEAHMLALGAWWEEVYAARKATRAVLGDIDVLLVQGFLQYALDFKHMRVAHPFKAMRREDIPRGPSIFRRKLLADLRSADGALGRTMQSYWPRHPFYEKTREALRKYRSIVATEAVPKFKVRGRIKRGMKGKKVLLLKRRLAGEGFYAGDVTDEVFGEDLEAAVKNFQRHRQLKETGVVANTYGLDGLTKRTLEVSMTRRVDSLKLSLQRWRESATEGDDYFFRVNVPQFEVEVWDGAEQVRKHRIVVGNNKFEEDPDHGRKGHLNRTALISDQIEKVVINPRWHVPERIRIHEIAVEAAKDPEYMEKNGYKTRVLADGTEQVFQEAGPGNALGRVKILFPNRHAIYMHDTPKRKLFKRTIRAYSHGCMRLKDPLDMATYILERDGTMDASEVQRVLKTKKERGVRLKEKIPIHIEYNTVAFEPGSDEPVFLNDIYKYDKAYFAGDVPLEPFTKIPIVKTEIPVPEVEEPDPRGADSAEPVAEPPAAEPVRVDPSPAAPPSSEPSRAAPSSPEPPPSER